MPTKEFDIKFQELFTGMVEVSFEFVNRNKKEIDCIYIYASMENNSLFFNVFYQVNGELTKLNLLNVVSKEQYDLSDDRTFNLLDVGNDLLEETMELFEDDEREVPTLMKMTYKPKTGAFDNDIIYEPQYSNDKDRSNVDGFNEWFEEVKANL